MKTIVKVWFREKEKPEGETALEKTEENIEEWETLLKDSLAKTGGRSKPQTFSSWLKIC